MKFPAALFLAIFAVLFLAACDDDDNGSMNYDIPSTYDFENVSYDGQLQRLAQMGEITTYNKTANTSGVSLDANRLQAMYANTTDAMWSAAYDESKQLRNKTLAAVQEDFDSYLSAIALASQSNVAASNGQAGVAVNAAGTKQYLLNENGVEYTQIIEKGLMGACFYYQATAVYMGPDRMNVDNETIEPGEGTEMEHHWDEAFGYFGVPLGFPADQDGLFFWGKYCNDRDALLNTNTALMGALLKGRAAISNKDLITRDEAILEARIAWERVVAGTAIHYINSTLENYNDFAGRAHALSEAVAFVYSLQFNPDKRITNSAISDLLAQLGGSADFNEMNFYNTTTENLMAVRDELATVFEMTDVADQL